ncbi:MAG: hypothetical protein GY720_03370 [bacterium]|nr:hypothetical protein [bacterium]
MTRTVKDAIPMLAVMDDYTLLGPIMRLQIQKERLVVGTRPDRVYRTEPLVPVDAVAISSEGVISNVDGGWVLDVHHTAHPASTRSELGRLLSIGFSAHYDAMAKHFAEAPYGIAGENIMVDTDRVITEDDIAGGLMIQRPDRQIQLKGAAVAEPCVPFTRFMLQDARAHVDDVKPNRDFLRRGMRGFVMGLDDLDETTTIELGDLVYARI